MMVRLEISWITMKILSVSDKYTFEGVSAVRRLI